MRIQDTIRGMTRTNALTVAELRERATVTVPEAAALLGLTEQTTYRMTRDGRLPATRLGRMVRVQAAALLHLLGDTEPAALQAVTESEADQ